MKKCDYCGLEKKILTKIDSTYICEECKEIVNEECQITVNKENLTDKKILKPVEIKKILDKYIVKQDEAKIALSSEIYNHLKRTYIKELSNNEKTNIMLIGPSGCGKTYLVSTIASILDIPMVTVSATEFTASGYVGKSVDSIGRWMLDAAEGDIERAERGIVFIDEIDKIACRNANGAMAYGSKDVGGLEVQKELLKIIEGTEIKLSDDDLFEIGEYDSINTKNMLFIFSGAFESLKEIIESGTEKKINLNNNSEDIILATDDIILSDQLIKYGFLKEFIGRVPIITKIEPLTEEDLVEIMTKKENNIISQYKKMFASDDIELKFNPSAIKYIAKIAIKSNLGARGLKSIISLLMNKLTYVNSSINKSSITITIPLINELLNIKKAKQTN
jgi:ATP-dependent Clp protease ATP-binding subunit ClpX